MILLSESSGTPASVTLETVIEAGKYEGMADIPAETYFAATKYASNSYLNESEQSPAHGQASRLVKREPTPAQEFGTLFHTACLEPERFERVVVVAPKFDRRTKDGKAAAAQWDIDNAGKTGIDAETMEQLLRMRDSVFKHPAARAALTEGKAEQSAFWRDRETGVMMKARFDYTHAERGVITDLKTTEDASPKAVERSLYKFRYHRQAALYLDGFNALHKTDTNLFLSVFCEKTAPFGVSVCAMKEPALELGRAEYRALLAREAECQRMGVWPCYADEIQLVDVPSWAYNADF